MCGIAGIWKLDGSVVNEYALRTFTDSMHHRGPDGSGYVLVNQNQLGLGHRRLSILDLSSAAAQPMTYADGRYTLTYNGEVFNFRELRDGLAGKGYTFKSDSDSEVILAAYAEYGEKCLQKFNGMWAFAIWDDQKKELFLARDRFGIKPLYYFHSAALLAFASETRAFKFLEGFNRQIDEQLASVNMRDVYALEGSGYTPFSRIFSLLPGHMMRLRLGHNELTQKRWWHIKDHLSEDIPATESQRAEKLYELLYDSCKLRLISDVPLGTALSGGLDSSSIYSVVSAVLNDHSAQRVNADSQRAFTAVFNGLPDDEEQYAEQAARYVGHEIHRIKTNYTGLSERIERDTKLSDFVNNFPITSIASVYDGMRREGIVVSMDGHGVDEMMYGYRDMVYSLYNRELWQGSQIGAAGFAEVLLGMQHPDSQKRVGLKFGEQLAVKKVRDSRLSRRILKSFRKDVSRMEFQTTRLPAIGEPYDFSSEPLKRRMVYHEFYVHTLPALLRNFDRAGMMNSVEIRMPFMDWRLVSYVFSLPPESKIGEGFTKLILRKAMKGHMEESIRTRTYKVGIASPVEQWFKEDLREWALDHLSPGALRDQLATEYRAGELNGNTVRTAWKTINLKLIN